MRRAGWWMVRVLVGLWAAAILNALLVRVTDESWERPLFAVVTVVCIATALLVRRTRPAR